MNEYLNACCILAEKGTSGHVIMMHFGNGDKPNDMSAMLFMIIQTTVNFLF